MHSDQQGRGQRNGDAVQHVEAQQGIAADESAARSKKRASEPEWINATSPLQERRPGPSLPRNGVARAMLLPTVMAQMASWSHGSR